MVETYIEDEDSPDDDLCWYTANKDDAVIPPKDKEMTPLRWIILILGCIMFIICLPIGILIIFAALGVGDDSRNIHQ